MSDNIISIKPNPSPEPTRDNLRLITARNLPAAQLVAAVKAAGFEVRSTGPMPNTITDDLGNEWPGDAYAGECLCEGLWWGTLIHGPTSDDPERIATAKLMVEVAAIHKAAAGE